MSVKSSRNFSTIAMRRNPLRLLLSTAWVPLAFRVGVSNPQQLTSTIICLILIEYPPPPLPPPLIFRDPVKLIGVWSSSKIAWNPDSTSIPPTFHMRVIPWRRYKLRMTPTHASTTWSGLQLVPTSGQILKLSVSFDYIHSDWDCRLVCHHHQLSYV